MYLVLRAKDIVLVLRTEKKEIAVGVLLVIINHLIKLLFSVFLGIVSISQIRLIRSLLNGDMTTDYNILLYILFKIHISWTHCETMSVRIHWLYLILLLFINDLLRSFGCYSLAYADDLNMYPTVD